MSDPKSRTGEDDKKSIAKMYAYSLRISIWTQFCLRIYANGGTLAQIIANQPNIYGVYGGMVTRLSF